jgi:hypothetical protein
MTTDERLEALFREARKAEGQKPRPRFSNAAGCIRAHVYDELALRDGKWEPEEERPARWNAAAACGTAVGELLERAAQRLGARTQVAAGLTASGFPAVENQCDGCRNGMPVDAWKIHRYEDESAHSVCSRELYDAFVSGSADIVWEDSVWDLKCVGDFAWRSAKKHPNPKHVVQVASYAHALGKPGWVLVYIDLGMIGKGRDLRYVTHEGRSDPAIAKKVVAHWRRVSECAEKRELPDRYRSEPDFECSLCKYREECWK